MVDPSILTTPAFRFIEKVFKTAILEGPTYICDIFWKFKFQRNVIKLKELEHHTDICNECTSGKSCKNCHKMSKNKMPMQAQLHKLEFCPKFTELDRLCPIELMLISQIIPVVYCYKQESCPAWTMCFSGNRLKKKKTISPRPCNEEYFISLALKLRLTDKSVVNSQQIRPAIINSALQK